MVYSHDGFGLGNLRRMLAICDYLLNDLSELSILLVSGSPMLQGFRLPKGLDYIKLPCLNRGENGNLVAKYLGAATDEMVQLRSDLILSTVASFKPDVLVVDKKPYGIRHELGATLDYCKTSLPKTRLVLLLRDILDNSETTIADWKTNHYYNAVEQFYNTILVAGIPEVFDVCKEYQFPLTIAKKVKYCGYIRRQPGNRSVNRVRQELRLSSGQRLVVVTPGGGEDGYPLIENYLSGLALLPASPNFHSLIICGPEMPLEQKKTLSQMARSFPHVQMGEFTDDLISYLAAADAVVAMGGYNTICEILSVGKRAVIVPRYKPSQEQLIRAARMSRLGLFKAIHPEQLTPRSLMRSLFLQLNCDHWSPGLHLDMDALPRISQYISQLLQVNRGTHKVTYLAEKLASASPIAVGSGG
jgi:predicted glycosyltransferase